MAKKLFRICRVGQTTDGREITLDQVNEMAASYSPDTYGARLNIEHYRSVYPSAGGFGAYGDVVALSVETDGDQTYLVAEIDPTPELIALSKARQKVYFSIEIDPKFADTGKAYLVGLACTDSPASLGTSYMQFCQQNPEISPLKAKKQTAHNLFSSADAEFFGAFHDDGNKTTLLDTIKGLFTAQDKKFDKVEESAKALEQLPQTLSSLQRAQETLAGGIDQISTQFSTMLKRIGDLEKGQQGQQQTLDKVEQTLDTTPPAHFRQRPKANGGGDEAIADC
jgi:hypothetical protein